jgi:hypothetical protein
MKKVLPNWAAIAAACLFFATYSVAFAEDEKREEPEPDEFVPLSEMKPLEKPFGYRNKHSYQYGVSAANTLINSAKKPTDIDKFNESAQQKQISDLRGGLFLGNYRPYLKYLYNETHAFNIRARIGYKYDPTQSALSQKQIDDTKTVVSTAEYNLELFNAEFNFDRHRVTAGRAFYRLGRGLLLANFADGAEYTGSFKYLQVKAQALYSGEYSGCSISINGCRTNSDADIPIKSAYNIVPGRPADAVVADAGKRIFLNAEIQSPALFGSNAYLLGMYSRDFARSEVTNAKNAADNGKIFAYDPIYLGLGLSGYVVTPRLRYLTEYILQRGQTYAASTGTGSTIVNKQIDIEAWGFTADLNYSVPFYERYVKLGLLAQYAAASGRDTDKTSPSSPSQQQTRGIDNNFHYFGVYSAGLALQPRISNLHIIRAGIQFRPLNYYYWGRNLMLSVRYSYYTKLNPQYVVSDSDASIPDQDKRRGFLGSAYDFQLVWDIRTDLKLFYSYGIFLPGAAYTDADAKTIHSHIVSLNFLF